jgi:diguanylate cyclase (GGDEF)-like protein
MEGSVIYQFTYYIAVIIVSMLSAALLLNSPAARTSQSRITIVYFSSFFASIAIGYIFMLFVPALGKLFAIGVVNLLILSGLYCLRIGLIWRKGERLHLWQAKFAVIHILIFTASQVTAEAVLTDAYWFRLANTSANGLLIVLGCLNLLTKGMGQSNYGENIARFSFVLLMITLSMLPVLYQSLNDSGYYYVAITVLIVVNIFALMGGLQSLLMTDVIDYHYQTSIKDPLTGIFNRRYFFQSVTGMSTTNEEHGSNSVILCDIDKFKQFNDKYGHDIGDEILVKFAVMLRESVGKKGIVSRYGGEEFSILLHQHTLPNAVEFAEQLRQNCERLLVKCDDKMVSITASFGVAEVWQLSDIDLALKLADDALLRAKASGRNRVVSN